MKILHGFILFGMACICASQMTAMTENVEVGPTGGAGGQGSFVQVDGGNAGNPGHIAIGVNTGAPGAPGGPFDFHSLFNNYFAQMAKMHADIANHADTYAFTTGDWKNAKAGSSMSYDTPQSIRGINAQLQQQQAQLANRIAGGIPQGQDGQGFAFAGTGAGPAQGAFASGSISDGGAYQSAAVFPENPGMPNVINRFSGGGAAPDGQGKFYGVMTSSSSHATNVNGKVERQHEAETIVNDNGKITKYKVKDP